MSMIGTQVLRREDDALLRGDARFVDDLPHRDGELHAVFVRSTDAHAVVAEVHVADAEAAPGVVAVYTGDTLGLDAQPPVAPFFDDATYRWGLARDRVRFAGEAVALVLAETLEQALDAAELVWVDADPLPAVVDLGTARESDIHLFPEIGSNVVASRGGNGGEPLGGAEVVVRRTIVNQRMAVASIEPRVIICEWERGRLTVDASTQGGFQMRAAMARVFGLEESDVRVRHADVGGGFGSKGTPSIEEIVVAHAARKLDRPVRWAEHRSSCMSSHGHARAQIHELALGAMLDGRLVGLEGEILQDAGAYPIVGAVLARLTAMMGVGPYVIPEASLAWASVATNTSPVGAYRGAGRPEATYAIERMIDALALEIAMDPVELRRKNLIPPDAFPLTTATGGSYDSGEYVAALDLAVDMVAYDAVRAEQAARRAAGDPKLLGVGISTYVEITAGGPSEDGVDMELGPDGNVIVRTGSAPQGQGHLTTWAMIAASELGVPMESVMVEMGDTDRMPWGPLVGGSRSAQSFGAAIVNASREFVSLASDEAAQLLEAAPADIVFDVEAAAFHVAGTPAKAATWADIAAHRRENLSLSFVAEEHPGSFPFGAHAVVVEVDSDTGAVGFVKYVAVDDCGTIINPMIVDGQVHGGIAGGAGQALYEELVYDDDGNLVTGNFMTYGIGAASEYPSFDRGVMETPSPNNVLGAKGIGESGTIGSMPAVVNAVIDAVSHLGISDLDAPLTPEKVWTAIQNGPGS